VCYISRNSTKKYSRKTRPPLSGAVSAYTIQLKNIAGKLRLPLNFLVCWTFRIKVFKRMWETPVFLFIALFYWRSMLNNIFIEFIYQNFCNLTGLSIPYYPSINLYNRNYLCCCTSKKNFIGYIHFCS